MLVRFGVVLVLVTSVWAGTNEAGKRYLDENAKKEGVTVLPSGLQYKVLQKGTGKVHPKADEPCFCHYKGTLIDGTRFDSSYERGKPTKFAPNEVIKGWTEAMQLMVEGDKWELVVPSELGYGDNGSPPKIKGWDVLVFQMELLRIAPELVSKEALAKRADASAVAEALKMQKEANSSAVVTLDDGNFATKLQEAPHFVKFYAPWCGHCKAIAPSFEALARELNPDEATAVVVQNKTRTRIAQMDCTVPGRQFTCKNFRVDGFPRLLLIDLRKDEAGRLHAYVVQYRGERELTPMRDFVLANNDVKAAQEQQSKAAAEGRKRAKAEAEILAKQQEEQARVHNAQNANKIVTKDNFNTFFDGANASDTSAFFLNVFVPKEFDMSAGTFKFLADKLVADGKDDHIAGSLNCKAFPDVCFEDPRLALPRNVQWPQVVKFRRRNMGGQFPGELYEGNIRDTKRVIAFLMDKKFSDEMHEVIETTAKERVAKQKHEKAFVSDVKGPAEDSKASKKDEL